MAGPPETSVRLCISGLAETRTQHLIEGVGALKGDVQLFHPHNVLHPDCSHLIVEKIVKTEKLLAALARGIPILDVSFIRQCLRNRDKKFDPAKAEAFDVGSKRRANDAEKSHFPRLSIRRQRKAKGGIFAGWRVGMFFPPAEARKVEVYARVLKEGDAACVRLLETPFDPVHVKQLELNTILSDPAHFKADEGLSSFRAADVKVCSYFYVVECLFRDKNPDHELFALDRKNMEIIHELQPRMALPSVGRRDSQPMFFGCVIGASQRLHDKQQQQQQRAAAAGFRGSPAKRTLPASPAKRTGFESPAKRQKFDSTPAPVGRTPSIREFFASIGNGPVQRKSSWTSVKPHRSSSDSTEPSLSEAQQHQTVGRRLSLKLDDEENAMSRRCSTLELRGGRLRSSPDHQSFSSQPSVSLRPDSDAAANVGAGSEEIGRKSLVFATERVQLQKAHSVMTGSEWADVDCRCKFRGSRYQDPLMKKHHPAPLQHWFLTMFETFTDENAMYSGQESEDLWLTVLKFLSDSVSSHRYPMLGILSVVWEAMGRNGSSKVRASCASFVKQLVLFHHPPVDAEAKQLYARTFSRPEVRGKACSDPSELLDVLTELVEGGDVLRLEVLTTFLQSEFSFWVECCLKTGKLFVPWPVVSRMFWSDEVAVVNAKVRTFFRLFCEASMRLGASKARNSLVSEMRKVTGMVAQVVDFCAKMRSETLGLRTAFADALAATVVEASCDLPADQLWTQLFMLKPDWLAALVSHRIVGGLSRTKSQSSGFALRQFVEDLVPVETLKMCRTATVNGVEDDPEPPEEEQQQQQKQGNLPTVMLTPMKVPLKPKDNRNNAIKVNKYGETPLHIACKKGNAGSVRALLCMPNVNINAADYNGWTPLHEACSYGQVECVQLLLNFRRRLIHSYFKTTASGSGTGENSDSRSKVDLWALGGEDKIPPLHDAVQSGHFSLVLLIMDFLEKNGDGTNLAKMLEFRTSGGKNAMDLAAANADMLALLKDAHSRHETDAKRVAELKALPTDPLKYLMVTSCYVYKYCAALRLPAMKELMKSSLARFDSQAGSFKDVRSVHIPSSQLTRFSLSRSAVEEAQDIRTFWTKLKKAMNGNPVLKSLLLYEDEVLL